MNRTICDDKDFGPLVHHCRDDFDFTLAFEDTMLSIAPSVSVLILGAGRILYLQKKPTLLRAKKLQLSKLTALVFYAVIQSSLIALWAVQPNMRSWSSVTATSLSLLNTCFLCSMSYLEHARNIRPSTIIVVYLLFSTLFDVVRSRTLWLVAPGSALARLYTTSIVLKSLVLVLESWEKAKFLPAEMSQRRPEETSSILNRGVFYWLNRFMIRGSRHVLLMDNMYELSEKMTAEQLGTSYLKHWQETHKKSGHSAWFTTMKTLKWPLLAPIIPRAILLALTICQPILLHNLLTYLSAPVDVTPNRIGYGIIGAYALVYTGTAVSTGFYEHKQYQFLTMVRGCLVSAISWKTAKLDILAVDDPKAAVTLMSTDVERITEGLRPLHDLWASIIQFGISLYLLQRQMGVACVVPVILSLFCGLGTGWTSGSSNKRQTEWMEAVQTRIGITSAMLSSIKVVKMRGMLEVLTRKIQNSRKQETRYANRWRWLLLLTVGLSFVPEYLSPVSTFMVYVIKARASGESFDVSRAFTTLSILTIMTQPLNGLIQSAPGLVSAFACFQRIGIFLSSEEQKDFRDLKVCCADGVELQNSVDVLSEDSDAIELRTGVAKPPGRQPSNGQPVIQITQGCFGWDDGNDILTDINVTIRRDRLTCIVGPVASGKSTLCHTLLGETRASKGRLEIFAPSQEIAFCHQSAYIINGTIKQNIIGFSEPDEAWYKTVIGDCALQEDVNAMPKQHDTVVGSGGVNLSGGQRQKIAVARAVYARKAVLVLDDVFSGFDASSEHHVFHRVVGPNGLARKHGMTVILATHAVKLLPYADHIVVLGVDGTVEQEGSYDVLRTQPGYVQGLEINTHPRIQGASAAKASGEISNDQNADEVAKQDLSRRLGEFAVYRYYFSVAGVKSTVITLVYVITSAAFFNISTFWLKLWTDTSSAPEQRDDYKYLGVYGLFQCLALIFLLLLVHQILIVIATKTGLELHLRLLQTVTNATLFFFSTTDTGTITNRFSQDMQLIDMQLPLGLLNLPFSVFLATGQIILIIASSPWVGLSFPIILAVFYMIQKFYLRTSRQLRLLELESKSPLYTNFLETLNGLATIRALGWTKQNLALNRRLLDLSQKPIYLLYMIQRWLSFVLDMIVAILAVLIAALAILQRRDSGFAGVALTQVLLVNLTLRSIIIAWTEVETSIGAVSRIKKFNEITSSEHGPAEISEVPIDWPHSGKIELKGITASYETAPDEPALRHLDINIQPGEKIGVCGRSGSGKSSLILALTRMLEIQSGSLKVDDLDLQRLPRNVIRQRLNVIPQESVFLPTTVRENLDPRTESTDREMVKALKMVELWSIFESKGGLEADIRSDLLSHGQRQLFSLASATLKKSKIVILDEATSNVDHETDALMQRIIRHEFRGCTIITVAHRLNTIVDFERVAVLDHGVLCELDSPQTLLSKDSKFRSMWIEQGHEAKDTLST